jgi:hypothetical protein
MRPLRNLVNELVERRLWPIALLLLVALLAVPLLLSKSASPAVDDGPETGTPPAAVAGAARAAAAPGAPVVSVTRDAVPAAPLRGRAKNPFRQQYEEPVLDGTTSTSTSTATSATQTPAGGSGSTPSGGTQGGGGSGGQTPPSSAQPTYVYAAIDVRFGKAGKRLRRIEDVPRLTPLPNADHPIVVFLGMRRDRETAVFLVSTDVHVQGLGQCVPSQRTCEAIELREGEAAFLDFTEADGTVQQYELDLDAVTLHETSSEAVAQRAYARVSRVGKLLLGGSVRSSADGAPRPRRLPFRYVRSSGVLHIAPWVSRRARDARAHRARSSARLADLTPAGR